MPLIAQMVCSKDDFTLWLAVRAMKQEAKTLLELSPQVNNYDVYIM